MGRRGFFLFLFSRPAQRFSFCAEILANLLQLREAQRRLRARNRASVSVSQNAQPRPERGKATDSLDVHDRARAFARGEQRVGWRVQGLRSPILTKSSTCSRLNRNLAEWLLSSFSVHSFSNSLFFEYGQPLVSIQERGFVTM